MGVLILFGLWAVVGAFFFCNPVHAFWDQTIRHPSCLPQKEVWFFNASMNIVTDLVIFLLPMPLLSVTHMPFKQKLAVMSMFSIGFFVCVTSAVRVVVMRNLINTPDISKNNAPVAAWSNIEANVAILCSCLPALYPLLTRFGSRHFPGSSRPRGKRSVHRGLGAYDPNWSIYQGQSGYAASVVGQENVEHPELEGIKVVQELRMESDLAGAVDLPKIAPAHHDPI
ncbi:hypothetical protein ASPZODRAFT_130726 [Penicilliopsis zonata CBS 506.65]|uniref:Rhodopsin domain-containing protein n=1 Tax=Penicilliopsis zonata CBS 506.65 TaxID=1073090 RepID=A0A1L9SNK8_9EURO|nr:hypothetical protein ASPZODRAFT_130726 [Penicilliopsis zonata CBS 506.65]OJJ48627.1 hypothetical protein ASPZODRAFT_130726 [Penicilliopsis zonata CBS 506.65]